MDELKVFQNNEFGDLGILLIDGKGYFPATRCAKALGYKNARDAILRHCKEVVKHDTLTEGGTQKVGYITEGDLYRLIVNSKLPAAERFERWVFDEVLPSLRKNSCYGNIDLEEVISKAVTIAVSETAKCLMPILKERTPVQEDTRIRRLNRSKIAQLEPDLRNLVDDMLLSRKYRYIDIKEFLCMHGVSISIAAIAKYKNTLYEK